MVGRLLSDSPFQRLSSDYLNIPRVAIESSHEDNWTEQTAPPGGDRGDGGEESRSLPGGQDPQKSGGTLV